MVYVLIHAIMSINVLMGTGANGIDIFHLYLSSNPFGVKIYPYSSPDIQYSIPLSYQNTQIVYTWCQYLFSILSYTVDHYPYLNLNPRNIVSIDILSDTVDHYLHSNLNLRNTVAIYLYICISDCLHSCLWDHIWVKRFESPTFKDTSTDLTEAKLVAPRSLEIG